MDVMMIGYLILYITLSVLFLYIMNIKLREYLVTIVKKYLISDSLSKIEKETKQESNELQHTSLLLLYETYIEGDIDNKNKLKYILVSLFSSFLLFFAVFSSTMLLFLTVMNITVVLITIYKDKLKLDSEILSAY